MTLHLAPELEQRLQQYAAELGRTPDDVAQEAVNQYIAHRRLLEAEVAEVEDEANRDGWLTQDEVFSRLKTIAKAA